MADIFMQNIDSTEEQDINKSITLSESDVEVIVINDETKEENARFGNIGNEDDMYNTPESLVELIELTNSEFIHHRQVAVKKLLNCFQSVDTNTEYQQNVISLMCKLSEDEEGMVRSELVQHIPSIALYCRSHSRELHKVIRQQLVPYTVKLLNDPQITVRKHSHTALLVLLENNLIDEAQLTEWICPLVSQLPMCEGNPEELRVEDVSMMGRMVQLVDQDTVVKFFLEPYISLCCDPAFGIRRICAMGFGSLVKMVGTDITELSLLPAFLNLCNDDRWGVKKACADVFVDVASVVTMKTRTEILSHVFMNLLNDGSRYVKCAAYQSIGGFIYTFADPEKLKEPSPTETYQEEHSTDLKQSDDNKHNHIDLSNEFSRGLSRHSRPRSLCLYVENDSRFNNFQFWREPLPEIELDIDFEGNKATNIRIRSKVPQSHCQSELNVNIAQTFDDIPSLEHQNRLASKKRCHINSLSYTNRVTYNALEDDFEVITSSFKEAVLTFNDEELLGIDESVNAPFVSYNAPCSMKRSLSVDHSSYDQDIVPADLLFKFTLLSDDLDVDVNSIKLSDDERVMFCAYNFPAVAYTLGRKYWPCIRKICQKLADVNRWAVRRTVASYLHELASFLGHQITSIDLLPIFLDLMKDVDEVRIKLVINMSEFLQCLHPVERKAFLPSIEEFFKIDSESNWRFRWAIAEHMKPVLQLYSSQEIFDHFVALAIVLLTDKVCAVRKAAVELLAAIVCLVHQNIETRIRTKQLLTEIHSVLFKSQKWRGRQMYILLCDEIAKQQSFPVNVFIQEFVPHLKILSWDKVPNVRLALCRSVALTLYPLGFLYSEEVEVQHLFKDLVSHLQKDSDKDVQWFAQLLPKVESHDEPETKESMNSISTEAADFF